MQALRWIYSPATGSSSSSSVFARALDSAIAAVAVFEKDQSSVIAGAHLLSRPSHGTRHFIAKLEPLISLAAAARSGLAQFAQ
jgi:hypothetical protein